MKKLVTIAMALCCAVAFGSACSPVVKDTGWVYEWKFTGKTTSGKSIKVPSSACNASVECTVRTPSSLKIQGYTYMCSPRECGSCAFETFAESMEVFYMTKPWKASLAGGVSTELSHIIGKSKKQYEGAGTATFVDGTTQYDLTYAGMGKYDVKDGHVKSFKGNFAGVCSESLCKKNCLSAGYWDCETLTLVCQAPTVAYGKFTCKYKKNASKKFAKYGKTVKLPAWAVPLNS